MSTRTDAPYLEYTADFYRDAAKAPQSTLCCTTSPVWSLPELQVPRAMLEMNYGCGSTVNYRDLRKDSTVLYVGVGAGLEALQFAYFTRRPGSVIAIDRVPEMLEASRRNFEEAARLNDWFDPSFVVLREGDALDLPIEDEQVDVAAQNCLFNIFEEEHLVHALDEMHRVLRPHGRLVLSDPVAEEEIPAHLRADQRLRAMCLSGALTYDRYLELMTQSGFGTIEVRSREPYRVLDPKRYDVDHAIVLDSVEVAAIKDPVAADGPCIFTGCYAIYVGDNGSFDDGAGHVFELDMPLAVCDKTAGNLKRLGNPDIIVTDPTYHYRGGGCC